jgi:hypothetical protein
MTGPFIFYMQHAAKLVPVHTMKFYVVLVLYFHSLLTSSRNKCNWSALQNVCFVLQDKVTSINLLERWVGTANILGCLEKRNIWYTCKEWKYNVLLFWPFNSVFKLSALLQFLHNSRKCYLNPFTNLKKDMWHNKQEIICKFALFPLLKLTIFRRVLSRPTVQNKSTEKVPGYLAPFSSNHRLIFFSVVVVI